MVEAIVAAVPIALGLMLVSSPVAVMVLVLMSAGDRRTVAAFLTGWTTGILVLSAAAIVIVDAPVDDSTASSSQWTNIVRIGVGAVALLLAAKNWTGRPKSHAEPPTPRWMATIESISPPKAGTTTS